jgi:aromatic-L-amino-acid decarboxylase
MGFPPGTAGLLTTGGSGATFNAIVCARETRLGTDIRAGTLYTSTQGHHCINKAAKLAGIAPDRVRAVPVDAQYRMDVAALADALRAEELRSWCRPPARRIQGDDTRCYCDTLRPRRSVNARGLRLHVPRTVVLHGLSRADSLTLDPHKGLFLPYGTGALLVRDGEQLRRVHSATAGYLPENQDEFYDPAQYGPELSRGFPGLRLWLTLKMYGAARYRAAIAEKRTLALRAAGDRGVPGIMRRPLSFAFRRWHRPPADESATCASSTHHCSRSRDVVRMRERRPSAGMRAELPTAGRRCVLHIAEAVAAQINISHSTIHYLFAA